MLTRGRTVRWCQISLNKIDASRELEFAPLVFSSSSSSSSRLLPNRQPNRARKTAHQWRRSAACNIIVDIKQLREAAELQTGCRLTPGSERSWCTLRQHRSTHAWFHWAEAGVHGSLSLVLQQNKNGGFQCFCSLLVSMHVIPRDACYYSFQYIMKMNRIFSGGVLIIMTSDRFSGVKFLFVIQK